jgi:hypothetical protein
MDALNAFENDFELLCTAIGKITPDELGDGRFWQAHWALDRMQMDLLQSRECCRSHAWTAPI